MSNKNNISYHENIKVQEAKIENLEDSLNEKKTSWFSTLLNVMKYPVGLWASISGGAITAWAIEMTGGGTISTQFALASLNPALGGAVLGTLVTGTFVVMGFKYISRITQAETIDEIHDESKRLAIVKSESLKDKKIEEPIDFVFNRASTLNTPEKKIIMPIKMSEEICDGIVIALKEKSSLNFVFRKVDISDAQLQDKYLEILLSAGIGNFSSQHLALRNNQLSDKSVRLLHKYIVKKGKAFQMLKSLDLSGNALTSECLPLLYEIALKLKLEDLDLSNNNLGEASKEIQHGIGFLDDFLYRQVNLLPFLKKLSLKNTGISDSNRLSLRCFFAGLNGVESLDLTENSELSYPCLNEYILKENQGLHLNLSLRELKTDHDSKLSLQKLIEQNNNRFEEAGHKPDQSRLIYIIRSLLNRVQLPLALKSKLELTHLKTFQSTVDIIESNEEYARNDSVWLTFLRKETEKLYSTRELDDQEKSAPPLLKQFKGQTNKNMQLEVFLLMESKNGLQLLFSNEYLFLFNPNTNRKKRFDMRGIGSEMQRQNKDLFVFPIENDKGEKIAMTFAKSGKFSFLKLKNNGGEVIGEEIFLKDLPRGSLMIDSSTWVNSYKAVAQMPEEIADETQSAPRMAS